MIRLIFLSRRPPPNELEFLMEVVPLILFDIILIIGNSFALNPDLWGRR